MKRGETVGLLLILEEGIPASRRNRIRTRLRELGAVVHYVEGGGRSYLEVSGEEIPLRTLSPQHWEGVAKAVPLEPEYPHSAWGTPDDGTRTPTVVRVGESTLVGGGHFVIMAGPCAIESEEQALRIATAVSAVGHVFRGGAFKPRTSPYAFQGLGEEGLRILGEVKGRAGLPVVTEVMSELQLDAVAEVADLLQVGSRNMQNFSLLKAVARQRRPVLLKRGFAATLDELLNAAEYILSGGNEQVILCERGVRSAAGADQVVLDLGAIPELRRRTHLPVIVDPSHGSAAAHRVGPLARAAVAAGADGLLIEVHEAPEEALSDGRQALRLAEFRQVAEEVMFIREALARTSEAGSISTPTERTGG